MRCYISLITHTNNHTTNLFIRLFVVDDDEENFDEDQKQEHLYSLKHSTVKDRKKVEDTLAKTKNMWRGMILYNLAEYEKYWQFYFADIELVSQY